jgi:hypothetical protein
VRIIIFKQYIQTQQKKMSLSLANEVRISNSLDFPLKARPFERITRELSLCRVQAERRGKEKKEK